MSMCKSGSLEYGKPLVSRDLLFHVNFSWEAIPSLFCSVRVS